MPQIIDRSSDVVRFSSDDQNIWKSGEAAQIRWSEYFPIVGGERSHFTVENLRILEGSGKLTMDGERIVYDSEGAYESLTSGETRTIKVAYDLIAEDDTRLPREVEIEARGLSVGTGFVIPETGDSSDDVLSFAAADAATILDDPHVFDTLTIIDLNFDSDEALEAALTGLATAIQGAKLNIERAERSVADAKADHAAARADADPFDEAAGAAAELGLKVTAAEAAKVAYDGAKLASDLLEAAELDKAAKAATLASSRLTFDAADLALVGAREATALAANAVSGASSALASLKKRISDWIPSWFKDGFDAAARFLGLDDDLNRADAKLDSALKTLSNKEALESAARKGFNNARDDVDAAEKAFNAAATDVIEKTDALADALGGATLEALKNARDSTATSRDEAQTKYDAAQAEVVRIAGTSDAGEIALIYAELKAIEAAAFAKIGLAEGDLLLAKTGLEALEVAQSGARGLVNGTDLRLQVEQTAEVEVQIGFQVDFGLNAGSVDSDVDLTFDTTAFLDATADTLTLSADAMNATTGESVAFQTEGPNFNLYAGFVYDMKAEMSSVLDAFARLGTFELFDFPTTSAPLATTATVQVDGWIDVLDFDNTTLAFDFDWPFGADWLDDILTISVAAPVLETEGYATEPTIDLFTDPTGFSLDELKGVLADLTNMRLDFGPEFRALLEKNGAAKSLDDRKLGEAFELVARALFDSVGEEADTDGDGFVPLFVADGSDSGVDGLFHINNIADMPPDDLSAIGQYGFFYAQGQSNDVLRVTVDLDQLAATVINVAYGNPPQTTINPLGWSIDLDEILNPKDGGKTSDKADNEKASNGKTEKENKDGLQRYFDFEAGYDILDVDARAGINFSQKFSLSFDDLDLKLTFEDDTTRMFKPGEDLVIENASSLVDSNGNGQIDYDIELTPSSTFFNDTQVGLSLGYQIDLLQAFAEASLGLPFDLIFKDLDWKLPLLSKRLSFGPVLQVKGDVDALSADIFEDSFAFDMGIGTTQGALPLLANPMMIDGAGSGGEGVDVLIGNASDDKIQGGGGADVVSGGEGSDELVGDTPGLLDDLEGGQVFRLYQAALGRLPDLAGLGRWMDDLKSRTMPLQDIAQAFIGSAEFAARFGQVTDNGYVELLYLNVLGRAPADTEIQGWLNRMGAGLDRVDVLLGFSESPEFKANSFAAQASLAARIDAAGWSDDVFRLYQAALDRAPDLKGFLRWIDDLAGDLTLTDAANGFIRSPEFDLIYGALDNASFVKLLYRNVLNREVSDEEAAGWIGRLDSGAQDRANVLLGFSNSPEFIRSVAQDLFDWIRAQGDDDILDGGPGSDTLTGGPLADTFVFDADQPGQDRVTDLERWDWLSFQGFGFAGPNDVRLAMTETPGAVVFNAQGVRVEFLGKALADIHNDMILV